MERLRQEVAPRARSCSPEPPGWPGRGRARRGAPRSALRPAGASRCAGSLLFSLRPASSVSVLREAERDRRKNKRGGKNWVPRAEQRGGKKKKETFPPNKVVRAVTPRPSANVPVPDREGSIPAGLPPRTGPGSSRRRGAGEGQDAVRQGSLPAAQPPRCPAAANAAPAASSCFFPGQRPPVMLNFPVPQCRSRGVGGRRAVPALAPADLSPAGAAAGPSPAAPTALPLRGAAPRTHRDEDPRFGLRPGQGLLPRIGAALSPTLGVGHSRSAAGARRCAPAQRF